MAPRCSAQNHGSWELSFASCWAAAELPAWFRASWSQSRLLEKGTPQAISTTVSLSSFSSSSPGSKREDSYLCVFENYCGTASLRYFTYKLKSFDSCWTDWLRGWIQRQMERSLWVDKKKWAWMDIEFLSNEFSISVEIFSFILLIYVIWSTWVILVNLSLRYTQFGLDITHIYVCIYMSVCIYIHTRIYGCF